jgi:hypothetical protein
MRAIAEISARRAVDRSLPKPEPGADLVQVVAYSMRRNQLIREVATQVVVETRTLLAARTSRRLTPLCHARTRTRPRSRVTRRVVRRRSRSPGREPPEPDEQHAVAASPGGAV